MVKARFYSRLLGALAAPDGQEQNGRWEMGKGRWEKGDGKREMGKGRCSKGLEPPPSHSPSVPCPSSQGSAPSFFIPRGFHPHGPKFVLGPRGQQCLERSHRAAAARCGCFPLENTINENPGKASRGVIKEISSILHDIGIIQSSINSLASQALALGLGRVSTLPQNGV